MSVALPKIGITTDENPEGTRRAQQDSFFRGLPFRNKLDGGKPSLIWGQKIESGLSAVSLRPCGPLALIPVNGKKNEIGGKIRTEK